MKNRRWIPYAFLVLGLTLILSLFVGSKTTIISNASLETAKDTGSYAMPIVYTKNIEADMPADESILDILEEDDLIISEESAYYIAEFFIRDIVETGLSSWNAETSIVNTVVMYDETGNEITGYTFELTSGYIVVSAYLDAPEIILEWSDEALPIYETFELDADAKIIYVNVLTYFLDEGESTLETVDGTEVPREEVINAFEEERDIENVPESIISDIIESNQVELADTNGFEFLASDNTAGGYITDPFTHAKNVYGGTWKSYEWSNYWESSANFAKTSDFSGYYNHCGPTAITNLIKMYGNKYSNAVIKYSSNKNVFDKVLEANNDQLIPYYVNSTSFIKGTLNARANGFIKDSFAKYSVTASVQGRYDASYENIKSCFLYSGRLMYLMVSGHAPYGDHHVVGYAYTRLISQQTGWYKSYVKICDGHNSSARYVDMASISSDRFWQVSF